MKKILITILILIGAGVTGLESKAQSGKVREMMWYIQLAEMAGLDVPLYVMDLSDQLAMAVAADLVNSELLVQAEAATRIYGHPLLCNNFAAALMARHRYNEALEFLGVGWHQDRENYMLATNLARCHYELNNDNEAEMFLNKALELNPDYGLALQLKANMLIGKGGKKNVKEGMGYFLRSAGSVWNAFSVRLAFTLIEYMKNQERRYFEEIKSLEEVELETPLDGHEKYFTSILKGGSKETASFPKRSFAYPVPDILIEYNPEETVHFLRYMLSGYVDTSGDYFKQSWDGATNTTKIESKHTDSKGADPAALGTFDNVYLQMARKVKKPLLPGDFPAGYDTRLESELFMPDSRQFLMTMLIYHHYKIKLLAAEHNRGVYSNKHVLPIEEKMQECIAAAEQELTDRLNRSVTPQDYASYLKYYPELISKVDAYSREYLNAEARALRFTYDKYVYPILKDVQDYMKTGLFYMENPLSREYVKRLYENLIYDNYEYNELYAFGSLQFEMNQNSAIRTAVEDFRDFASEQEYKDRMQNRLTKWVQWSNEQKMMEAGLGDIRKIENSPKPRLAIALFGQRWEYGTVDGYRVTRHITDDKIEQTITNTATGANCSTVLERVDIRQDKRALAQANAFGIDERAAYKLYADDSFYGGKNKVVLGSYNEGVYLGNRIVTDNNGNMLMSERQAIVSQSPTTHQGSFSVPFDPSRTFAEHIHDSFTGLTGAALNAYTDYVAGVSSPPSVGYTGGVANISSDGKLRSMTTFSSDDLNELGQAFSSATLSSTHQQVFTQGRYQASVTPVSKRTVFAGATMAVFGVQIAGAGIVTGN